MIEAVRARPHRGHVEKERAPVATNVRQCDQWRHVYSLMGLEDSHCRARALAFGRELENAHEKLVGKSSVNEGAGIQAAADADNDRCRQLEEHTMKSF